jgi:hypothetical protein
MQQFLKFILGIKLYVFRTVPLSIIRSFSLYTLYTQQYTQQTACELESCLQNCMTYTIAVCTVKNS